MPGPIANVHCVLCHKRIRKGPAPPLTRKYAGLCEKCRSRAKRAASSSDSGSNSSSASDCESSGSESDRESAGSESGSESTGSESGSESDGSPAARWRPPKFSISPLEPQRLEKVGGVGERHNPSREKEVASAGLSLSDWASAKGPRVAAAGGGGGGGSGGGSGATAGAVPSDGDGQTAAAAAASTPAPRPKRVVRRRRHLHGEGDGVNADAQSAKERPFDHMANAVGTGKRLIQMELLLPWMERHLCCRKCSETAAKQNLTTTWCRAPGV